MVIPDHNVENLQYEEPFEQWVCAQCFKTISSTRLPVFNPEYCSCVEVTAGGSGALVSQPLDIEKPLYHCDTAIDPLYHNRFHSDASSKSFNPEGPERENPNMHLASGVDQDPILNEPQHHYSELEMSYQMLRFLVEDGYHHESGYGSTEHAPEFSNMVLTQDGKRSKKVKKGSKLSWVSLESGRGSGDEAFSAGFGVEFTAMTGAWMDDEDLELGFRDWTVDVERGEVWEYPLAMSGITERGGFERGCN